LSKSREFPRERDGRKIEGSRAVRAALLRWYRNHARPLPWRNTKDPYAIWVSEIMLQQTQVATVIPYYQRFLRAFPNCKSLADAPFGKVAEQWSGLGYYRRARLLQRGARKVLEDFGGRFPTTYGQAREISGVGHYTASAVLSIAYNRPLPVLDGNVARVVARLETLQGNFGESEFRRAAEAWLSRLISVRRPGSFNQAIMELGQTVCLPRAPLCHACPVRKWCRARKVGHPQDFPAPRRRRATELRYMATAVIRKKDEIALIRGLDEGLLEDLWNFPSAFGKTQEQALENLRAKLAGLAGTRFVDRQLLCQGRIGTVRHGITFRSIHVALHKVELRAELPNTLFYWLPISQVRNAAVSQLTKKIASVLQP
jgi:A/G-specific adenine glycosylase